MMFVGIDSKGIDLEPARDNQELYALFFMSFVIVGAFFVINLFAGVIVDTFLSEKKRLSKGGGDSLI